MEEPVTEKMVTTVCAHCGNVIDVTGLEPGDGITCPYCNKEFSITRQFGNFLLERHLGSGGMGTVFLGHDMTLNREVAVKVLKPELVSDHKFMATFLREAEITASLNHPNIVQVYAFGQHEKVYYLVVEYISGSSLDDKIMTLGKVTELEGIEIGIAVARGLECALQRGLIHRDIKPGNILFNANNTPKVVDFGLSLSFETTDHFDGEIWGTPYYVAPEKLERLPEDFRSDLYSLGATLFHAISGRPAYEGDDPNDVAMKHLNGNVVSLKAFVPDISDQTAFAVSKAMARHPKDRYESYAAFISQLEDAKRRITDPRFRDKKKEDVVILDTTNSAKYQGIFVIGIVVITILLLGLIVWKGSSLFQQKKDKPAANIVDYNPITAPTEQPVTPEAPAAAPTPTPTFGIVDGNFETPNVVGGADTFQYDPAGGAWTFSGKSGIQSNGSPWAAPPAPSGTQTAFLQCLPGETRGSMSQTVNFSAAGSYTLSFQSALRGVYSSGKISFDVLVDNVVVGTYAPTITTTFTSYFTKPFAIATAGEHTVTFTAVGADSKTDSSVFIDDVSIQAASSSPISVQITSSPPPGPPPSFGIVNASFETPNVGSSADAFQYNPTGGTWTFSGKSGIQSNGSPWGAPSAPSGTQTAFLQCLPGETRGSMSQTINFSAAGSYTLSFQSALRGIYSSGKISFDVLVDNVVVGTYAPTITTTFTSYTTKPFAIATAGDHTVTFTAVGADSKTDSSVFIDDVSMAIKK